MVKQSICKYAKRCAFFSKIHTESESDFIILRNVFCRSNHAVWEECRRYKLNEKGLVPLVEITPNDKRPLEVLIRNVNVDE